jgi:hypothetical protein
MRIIIITALSAHLGCTGLVASARTPTTSDLRCIEEPLELEPFFLSQGSVVVNVDYLGRLTPVCDDPLADIIARFCRLPTSSRRARIVTIPIRLEWVP